MSLPLSRTILEAEPAPKEKKKKKSSKKAQLSKEEEKALGWFLGSALFCCHVHSRLAEKDLKEGEAEVSVEHRKRVQTAILTEVFTTFFR